MNNEYYKHINTIQELNKTRQATGLNDWNCGYWAVDCRLYSVSREANILWSTCENDLHNTASQSEPHPDSNQHSSTWLTNWPGWRSDHNRCSQLLRMFDNEVGILIEHRASFRWTDEPLLWLSDVYRWTADYEKWESQTHEPSGGQKTNDTSWGKTMKDISLRSIIATEDESSTVGRTSAALTNQMKLTSDAASISGSGFWRLFISCKTTRHSWSR